MLRPSQCGKRPQCRREPGIQGIGILGKVRIAAFRTYAGLFIRHYDFTALIAVISGDSVSPPELTADTPVADIVRPVIVNFLHTLRNQPDLTIFHCFHRRPYQFIHLHKPLFLNQRLNRCLTAVMGSHIMGIVFDTYQKPFLLQLFHNLLPCLIAV